MKNNTKSQDAVSPVIGVMLMLVVTIIIAAVVAAFAGGLGSSTQATPTIVFDAKYSQADGLTIECLGSSTSYDLEAGGDFDLVISGAGDSDLSFEPAVSGAFAPGKSLSVNRKAIEDELYARFGHNTTGPGTTYKSGWYPNNPDNIGKSIKITLLSPDGKTVIGETKTAIRA